MRRTAPQRFLAELHDAGPLRVLLRIDDPWTVSSWPVWPGPKAYACAAPGVPPSADPEEENLSRFVAGEAELPELTSHLGWLWRLVDLAVALVEAGARTDLAECCTNELRRRPRAALLALTDEELSQADVTHALITTGLAATPPDTAPWQPGRARTLERLWATFPAAAAVAVGDLFGNDDLADAAITQCGDSLAEILKGHADPHAAVGRFGPEAERMATWPPESGRCPVAGRRRRPQAMLDEDTRLMAARRMFDARHETADALAAASVAKTITRTAETLIGQSACPGLTDAISARHPAGGRGGWLALPAMSIAMALLARLAARGNRNAAMLEREYRGKWGNLALDAPELVAIDLVLAEALVVVPDGSPGGISVTDRFDPLATSAADHRRLPALPALAAPGTRPADRDGARLPDHAQPAAHQGAAAGSHSALRSTARRSTR